MIIHKKDGTIQAEHTYGKDPATGKTRAERVKSN